MFAHLPHWFSFFHPQRTQDARPVPPASAPPSGREYGFRVTAAARSERMPPGPQAPNPSQRDASTTQALASLFASIEGRVQLFFCQLLEDWRQPFTDELRRILRQRRRGGYLPLPPPRVPLARERLGKYGEALRPLETPAVYDLLRRQVEEGLRVLELPEEALSQARRCSDLAWQAARLWQLVRELDRPRRKTDAWQALWQALWTLPGARVPPVRQK